MDGRWSRGWEAIVGPGPTPTKEGKHYPAPIFYRPAFSHPPTPILPLLSIGGGQGIYIDIAGGGGETLHPGLPRQSVVAFGFPRDYLSPVDRIDDPINFRAPAPHRNNLWTPGAGLHGHRASIPTGLD
jgi:hypothetical protein